MLPKNATSRMTNQRLHLVLVILLAPLAAWAQATGPLTSALQGPASFGTGEQPDLNYTSEVVPENLASFYLDSETAYDSNVLNEKKGLGELTASLGPRVDLLLRRKKFDFGVDYQPYFLLYGRTTQLDTINHTLALDSGYEVSPHLSLRLRNSFRYQNYPTGIFEPRSSQGFEPGLGSPTGLNETILTPLARTERYNGRLDAVYQMSGRTSLDFFGGFLDRKYTHRTTHSERLFGLEGADGGFRYSYRLSPTSTFGATYSFQNLSFGGGARVVIHGGTFSYARQLSPTVTFSVFAGPEFSRLHDSFVVEIPFLSILLGVPVRIVRGSWHPTLGGTFIKQSSKTVFELSGQRVVTDGGGFYSAAINTSFDLNVRRRLTGRWNVVETAEYARTSAVSGGLFNSNIRYARAGVGLERNLTPRLTWRLAYNYLSQRGGGQIPLESNLDRTRVSLGLFYQVGGIRLGR
jgi:hypothetical protein